MRVEPRGKGWENKEPLTKLRHLCNVKGRREGEKRGPPSGVAPPAAWPSSLRDVEQVSRACMFTQVSYQLVLNKNTVYYIDFYVYSLSSWVWDVKIQADVVVRRVFCLVPCKYNSWFCFCIHFNLTFYLRTEYTLLQPDSPNVVRICCFYTLEPEPPSAASQLTSYQSVFHCQRSSLLTLTPASLSSVNTCQSAQHNINPEHIGLLFLRIPIAKSELLKRIRVATPSKSLCPEASTSQP